MAAKLPTNTLRVESVPEDHFDLATNEISVIEHTTGGRQVRRAAE